MFTGEEKRGYTRAASAQKSVRAGGKHNDLENVGYTARHHTFFEMLGNFSFGDYFKREAIEWAWDLLTNGYKLDPSKLYVSVYKDDDEAFNIWNKEMGLDVSRIIRLGEKDNFWAMGDTGPCGPCSEILYDQGPEVGCGRPECAPGCDCDRYLEIWNLVFTQFDREASGKLNPLPKPNIDTGMGLERITAVVQGVKSNYDTDIFRDIIARVEELAGKKYGDDPKADLSFRVIADHARSSAFLIGDGVMPSNEGRGYVLRRIIRRAIRYGQALGMKDPFFHKAAGRVIEVMGHDYGELISHRAFIEGILLSEEKRFSDTLFYAMKILRDEIDKLRANNKVVIPGDLAFKLYDTYGLSIDIVEDVARDEGLKVDRGGYDEAMGRQKSQSQESWKGSGEEAIPEAYRGLGTRGITTQFIGYETLQSEAKIVSIIKGGQEATNASEGDEVEVILDKSPFYGESGGQQGDAGWITKEGMTLMVTGTAKFGKGLISHRGIVESGSISVGDKVEAVVDEERRRATALNHTATHLLHAALREVLGDHVKQAGSLVSSERLRFDFSHFTQVSREQLKEVEALVNNHVRGNHAVSTIETSREEAVKTGAMAIFEERYGDKVRLVSVGEDVSKELCGGTHTGMSGDIGLFLIVSEGAVAANVRRIEALTGKGAIDYLQKQDNDIKDSASILKTTPDHMMERIEQLLNDQKTREREIESLKSKIMQMQSGDLLADVKEIDGVKFVVKEVDADTPKDLRDYADKIKDKLKSGVIVLGATKDDKVMLICSVTDDLTKKVKAGDIIKRLSEIVGGKGGGRPDMAQGGGNKPEELGRALESVLKNF
jgi:alanyl-tRNA synthetase